MHHQHLQMLDIPRTVKLPYPLQSLGYIRSSEIQPACNCYKDKIEFCLRLSSDGESEAVDILNGREYHTPFPHIIIKAPGIRHEYTTRGHREAFYFIYQAKVIPRLTEAGIDLQPYIWELSLTPLIHQTIIQLKHLFQHTHESGIAEQMDLYCFLLLEEFIRLRNQQQEPDGFYGKKIHSIASYLQLHYNEENCLDRQIQKYGLSRRSFFRYWKKFYSIPPLQLIQKFKLDELERLLHETDLSISEIASELHFQNTSYMIRLFHRRFGTSPLQYRNNHRGS